MSNRETELSTAIRWLRVSYLVGAVSDGLIGILMLLPSRMGEAEFRYPMGLGASLMFGWVVLLLWANNKPMERKGVLIITIFPAITGLVATGIWAVQAGLFPMQKIVPSTILGLAMIVLMGFSYWRARVVEEPGVT
jgi:hypothetical protein